MKIIIASDIHGSTAHCLKFIKACYLEQVQTVLLLGDLLDGNREVAEMLNSLNREKAILCVRGNCDYPEDQAMLEFPIMAEYCLLFISGRIVFATHGHRSIPKLSSGSILLHGHTHAPAWDWKSGFLDLCPGSVSRPRRNSRNSYMVLDDNSFVWKDLDGRTYHEMPFSSVADSFDEVTVIG